MTKTLFHDDIYDLYAVDFFQNLFQPKVELFEFDVLKTEKHENYMDDIFNEIKDSKRIENYDPLL